MAEEVQTAAGNAPDGGATPATNEAGATPSTPADAGTKQATKETKADTQPNDAGDNKPADGEKPQQKTPDAYEYKLPEGFQVDETMKGDFDKLAKDLGLGQDAHGKIVDMGTKLVQKVQADLANAVAAQQEQWLTQTKADKEIGGDKLNSVVASTSQVMSKFATPELKAVLESTGIGNHPEMIRFVNRIAKELGVGEGTIHAGNGGGSVQKSDAEVLFGNTKPSNA